MTFSHRTPTWQHNHLCVIKLQQEGRGKQNFADFADFIKFPGCAGR